MFAARPKFVIAIKNGDGSERYYFRRRGVPLRRLPDIGHDEFRPAYEAAIQETEATTPATSRFEHGYRLQHATMLHAKMKSRCVSQYQGVDCTIGVADIVRMLEDQDDRCALSGLKFRYRKPSDMRRPDPYAPSIDRVNSRGHYEIGNVRMVLFAVNIALNEWGDETFVRICKAVARSDAAKK